MVSNDVEALAPGEACQALLLTAKARVIAPLTILRRGRRRLPPSHRARARRACRGRARPLPIRCQVRDRGRAALLHDRPRRPAARRSPADGRLRRAGVRDPRRRPGDGRRGRCRRARAAADPRPHARVGARARRPRVAGRGGSRGSCDQLHEGVLSGPGAGGAPALPRPPEPRPARALARGHSTAPPTTPS